MAEKRTAKNKLLQLIEAVSADDVKKVEALLAGGADASARDDRGLTLLMHAARSTDTPRIVKRLLDAGADPAATDDHGWSALRYAQRREPSKAQQAIVSMLGGKSPRGGSSGTKKRRTAARSRGTLKGLGRRLLGRIAAEVKEWGPGKWILHIGLPLAPILLFTIIVVDSGEHMDPEAWLALGRLFLLSLALFPIVFLFGMAFSAPTDGKVDKVISRAWAETAEQPGIPPLIAALLKREGPRKLRSLIEDGADVNQRTEDRGVTALMWAALDCPDPAVFQVFLEAGAKVDASDIDGARALFHAAASNENPEVVRVLLEAGADVNAVNKGGKSALDMALERSKQDKGRAEIVKFLENAGARAHGGRKKR
jgi:ankyrin repeat protein